MVHFVHPTLFSFTILQFDWKQCISKLLIGDIAHPLSTGKSVLFELKKTKIFMSSYNNVEQRVKIFCSLIKANSEDFVCK